MEVKGLVGYLSIVLLKISLASAPHAPDTSSATHLDWDPHVALSMPYSIALVYLNISLSFLP